MAIFTVIDVLKSSSMNFVQDLRYAARTLRKSPGFAIMAILILGLGIGANSAIFSVVNSVVLRPLPYPYADRLVVIWETNRRLGAAREGPSGPNYLDWKAQNRTFDDMGLIENGTGVLTGNGEPEQFPGARVTPNLLDILGAKAILGRTFTSTESDGTERHNVAVLTYGFWIRRFGSDRRVIGSLVTINHEPYTVVGVLSPSFWAPVRCDAFVPWPEGELRARHRDWRDFGVIGRLKAGVSLAAAQQDMNAITARIAQEYPHEQGWGVTLVPFQDALTEYIRPALLLLLAAVAFVLLLACANVSNLLLARITSRQREIGIRSAMGAGRTRLLAQFLTENLLLSATGGAVGLLIAVWAMDLLGRALPQTVPLPNAATEVVLPRIAVDGQVLLFTFGISLLCALLLGVLPALSAARPDLNAVLKDTGRSATGGQRRQRVRRLLVISETALAFVLLMGAGLMLRTFINIQNIDAGIRPDHVLTFHVKLETDTKYKNGAQVRDFARDALANIQNIRGVQSAGLTDVLPLSQESNRESFYLEGRSARTQELMADFRRATPDYFRTMGIALLSGRGFSEHDTATTLPVAIIDEPLASAYFPHGGAVGKRLMVVRQWRQIAGVVRGVRHYGLEQPAHPTIYVPFAQIPSERIGVAIKTNADTRAMVAAVKRAIWAVDKDEPVFLVRTMSEYVSLATSAPRIALLLLGVFAALAIVLAALGIYAVVSYTVSQRLQEFGIRIALGARPADVRRLIVRSGLKTAGIGLACGLAAIIVVAPVLRSFLYGVGAVDTVVIAAASLFLLLVALAANYIPALRATRADPMTALRCE